MKKFLAVLFAVMFAFSACCVAFAAPAELTCDFCHAEFETAAELKAHIESTFPNADHSKTCTNTIIVDGVVTKCGEVFHSKAAYDAHQTTCSNASDADLMKAYFKAGDIGAALKCLFNIIVDFVKGDTFKGIIDKVGGVVKGIDLGGIFNTVKDLVSKIPFDDILGKLGIEL